MKANPVKQKPVFHSHIFHQFLTHSILDSENLLADSPIPSSSFPLIAIKHFSDTLNETLCSHTFQPILPFFLFLLKCDY